MKTKNIAITICAMMFFLFGCSPSANESSQSVSDKNQPVTKNQNGQIVTIHTNEIVQITLDGNPTTGYAWETNNLDQTLLQQQGEPIYTQPDSKKLVGAGGTYLFTFQAIKEGQTTLTLVYHRPWEKDTPPAETFEITVNILK